MTVPSLTRRPSPPPLDPPPVVDWRPWYGGEARTWTEGVDAFTGEREGAGHLLISGPTGSGKTLLCRYVVRIRNFVVVIGTKPRDPSLQAYVDEGYLRIDHWPPTSHDLREMPTDDVRLIVWPEMKSRHDLFRHRDLFEKVLDDVYVDGRWCVVIDEGLWASNKLGLGDAMDVIAYGGRSNLVSLVMLVQRPANVPVTCWTNCTQALIFHTGYDSDLDKLASLGTYPHKQVQFAIEGLTGHQFLDLPVRGQAAWAISEVDPGWEWE